MNEKMRELCSLLGIEAPIFQGGMAWVANASLAAGVSEAGGLGTIAAMNSNGEQLRAEIQKLREKTDKPFAVNIMLMSPFKDEVAKVVMEEKVPIVTTGAGNPSAYMKDWLAHGIKVIPVIASVAHAKMMEKRGASAVIAEGMEAGGHIGPSTTMTLLPMVTDAVKIPVVAAGGIADGRGFLAALALGASGIQMGTRFLVAEECTIHQNYKEKVLKANDRETIVTGNRTGHPVRALKSDFTRNYADHEYNPNVTLEEIEQLGVGALRKAVLDGNLEEGCFMTGISAGLVTKEETCKEIIADMMNDLQKQIGIVASWEK